MLSPAHLAFAAAFLIVVRSSAPAAAARPIFAGKPSPSEATATARWLAAQNTWGVLRFPPVHPETLLPVLLPPRFGAGASSLATGVLLKFLGG